MPNIPLTTRQTALVQEATDAYNAGAATTLTPAAWCRAAILAAARETVTTTRGNAALSAIAKAVDADIATP